MSNEPQPRTILIVEDEAPLRRALSDKFEREGFHVYEAKDGEMGLAVALKEQPQIILLDMMMPKMDGITMLHHLRLANAWGKEVSVLLLTNVSSDDKRMLREVLDDEKASYLVKSDWPISRLVDRVREILAEEF